MMMERKDDIPEGLYEDEAVRFIANRHGVTPQEAVRCLLMQGDNKPGLRLEDNEMEILRGLMEAYRSMTGE